MTIETVGLGKRYGAMWALRGCTIDVPAGSVCALVGANGAGKTTLLKLLTGLAQPTEGSLSVANRRPAEGTEFLANVGFLAQNIPLYSRWTVSDHLRLGASLNPAWDDNAARAHLARAKIPLDRRVEQLSGGMHAQVGLALALAKRPQVLLLDEPVAALDPLARRTFLAALAEAVVEHDLTVMLSSHLLADLERVCDHLVLLAGGTVALCADTDAVMASHKRVTGPADELGTLMRQHRVVFAERTARQASAIVELGHAPLGDGWYVDNVGLEDIALAYLGRAAEHELVAP